MPSPDRANSSAPPDRHAPLRRMAVIAADRMPEIMEVSEPNPSGTAVSPAMRLLQAGVPLTLLLDLCAQEGPDSAVIIARESPDGIASMG